MVNTARNSIVKFRRTLHCFISCLRIDIVFLFYKKKRTMSHTTNFYFIVGALTKILTKYYLFSNFLNFMQVLEVFCFAVIFIL